MAWRLRPAPDSQKPWLLKKVASLHLHSFGNLVSRTTQEVRFAQSGLELLRVPRQMLTKLELLSQADASGCDETHTMPLTMSGLQILEQYKRQSAALWQAITN